MNQGHMSVTRVDYECSVIWYWVYGISHPRNYYKDISDKGLRRSRPKQLID